MASPAAAAMTFTVNDQTDAPLMDPTGTACVSTDSSQCTLRAAIQAADNIAGTNADPDAKVTISLPPGMYKLTLPAVSALNSTDDPSLGDLDIEHLNGATLSPEVTITGAGAGSTTIDANSIDRAFTIHLGSSLSISGVTIENGSSESNVAGTASGNSEVPGDGGAILNAGALKVADSELVSNKTNARGGAIYTTGDLTVTGSAFAGNSADTIGGAIVDEGSGLVKLVNDTIADNSSTDAAVAYATPGGTQAAAGSELLNVTIAENSGIGIYEAGLAGTIENTIVAGNTGATQCQTGSAALADAGGNVGSDSSCFSSTVNKDLTNADPKLGTFGDHGGPSATLPLLAGSPAIGRAIAAACPPTDQRGVPRKPSACDSGAYQTAPPVNADAPTITGTTELGDTLGASTGGWMNGPTAFAYQWEDCRAGDCFDIPRATDALYVITGSNLGNTIVVVVTATNADGSAVATSAPTDPVPLPTVNIGSAQNSGTTSTVVLQCSDAFSCSVLVTLELLGAASTDTNVATGSTAAHHKPIIVGSAKTTIPGGKTKKVKIKLNKTGRLLLAKHHRLKVKLTITLDGHTVSTRTLTFKAKRPRKHSHRGG